MGKDYVVLSLSQEAPSLFQHKRSIWRSWKRLSRLQRNLVSIFLLSFFMLISYIFIPNFINKNERIESGSIDNEAGNNGLLVGDRISVASSPPSYDQVVDDETRNKILSDSNLKKPKIKVNGKGNNEGKSKDTVDAGALDQPEVQVAKEKKAAGVKAVIFDSEVTERQKRVVDSLKHAWSCYRDHAWGHDHLRPITKGYHDWFGLGLTIIDALDTLYIMGLKKEFDEAREWIAKSLEVNRYTDVNLFEVTIRVLGGLLSAYHLSSDSLFLDKAKDVGERLMPCFTRSPSAIPYSDVNLASHMAHSPRWSPDSSTSEVTSIQLEFTALARATKNENFEGVVSRVSEHVHGLPKKDGLVPVFINPRTGQFQQYSDIKLGARGDSYYEYLLKQYIQTGKTIQYLRDDYVEAVNGIEKNLVRQTPRKKYTYIGELKGGSRDFVPKMDHLVCYLPGTLALGYHHGLPESHLNLAEKLIETCYATYMERPTKLAPEISYFALEGEELKDDIYVNGNDAHNLLRPETVESLWYLYQVTGNATYQDWAWNIFQSFEKYTRRECGYSSIGNVNDVEDTKPRDMMESFFLGETLKYFYLVFSNDRHLLSIDKFVVNTEAHPLPIYTE